MTRIELSPRDNPHLFGHAAAERTLLAAWRGGRLPHAWLVTGPRGIGKATLAFRFARFVLAGGGGGGLPGLAPEDLSLPTDHPVFRRMAAGAVADFRLVTRGINPDSGKLRGEIVVDDIRDMAAFQRLTPAEGGWRVVVIDAAEDMNRNAANALLKILEEPGGRSLLLLVSHAPGRLLPTVRSRCRRLDLRPLASGDVVAALACLCPETPATEARLAAELAEGSVGRAVALLAQGGLDLHRELAGILDAMPGLDVPALHALADRVGRAGADGAFEMLTGMVHQWLGRRIRDQARGGGLAQLDPWLELWDKIGRLFARTGSLNLDRKQVVLDAFLAIEATSRA